MVAYHSNQESGYKLRLNFKYSKPAACFSPIRTLQSGRIPEVVINIYQQLQSVFILENRLYKLFLQSVKVLIDFLTYFYLKPIEHLFSKQVIQ